MLPNIDFLNVMGDADQHYINERNSLNDKRTDLKYDIGDHLRWLAASAVGRGDEFSQETMRQEVAKAENKRLNEQTRQQRARIKLLDPTADGLKITSGVLEGDHQDMLDGKEAVLTYAEQVKARHPRIDLTGATTIPQIQAAERNFIETDPHGTIQRTIKAENKEQDLAEKMDRRYYADRADARRQENNNLKMQMMMLERDERREARDRKDRIHAQLIAGLQNLGQAFTI